MCFSTTDEEGRERGREESLPKRLKNSRDLSTELLELKGSMPVFRWNFAFPVLVKG